MRSSDSRGELLSDVDGSTSGFAATCVVVLVAAPVTLCCCIGAWEVLLNGTILLLLAVEFTLELELLLRPSASVVLGEKSGDASAPG